MADREMEAFFGSCLLFFILFYFNINYKNEGIADPCGLLFRTEMMEWVEVG